tara:strand:- start:166 stop:774 length:609 start_codon:yes stop_codon:yes gene_type:complete
MDFISLFPTTILKEKLTNISSPQNQEYYNFLNNSKNFPLGENKGTITTINQNILDLPLFLNLKIQILNYAKLYLDRLGHKYEDVQVSNSWGTMTSNNQQSIPHHHSNSYISGVYYLSSGSNIIFYSPTTEKWTFSPDIKFKENNPSTYQSYYITPSPSLLLLFPSYVYHQIEENKSSDRFSIAFNIIPKGEFGRKSAKLYLK